VAEKAEPPDGSADVPARRGATGGSPRAPDDVDRTLSRLLDAVLLVTSDLSLHAVLDHIIESACAMVDARYGALGVIGRDGLLAEFVHRGFDASTIEAIGHLPRGRGILGTLISDPQPLRLEDLTRDPRSAGFPERHPPMHSFLGVPIHVRGQVYGNLYLTEKVGGGHFTAQDEELVVALAAVAGSAIGNARAQQQYAELAVVEERERIGRDLHDTVMQRLFATGLELQVVAGRLPAAQYTAAAQLEKAVTDLDDTIREIRTTIFSFHDTVAEGNRGLTRAELIRSVGDIVAEATRPLGFHPTYLPQVIGEARVPGVVVDHLLNAVREGLTNVARHAQARTVEVFLTVGAHVELVISDDGVGVGDAANPDRHGYGLRNLRQRAESLGGTCVLAQREDGGTRLE
jgi:signal transduction histidine kinase